MSLDLPTVPSDLVEVRTPVVCIPEVRIPEVGIPEIRIPEVRISVVRIPVVRTKVDTLIRISRTIRMNRTIRPPKGCPGEATSEFRAWMREVGEMSGR